MFRIPCILASNALKNIFSVTVAPTFLRFASTRNESVMKHLSQCHEYNIEIIFYTNNSRRYVEIEHQLSGSGLTPSDYAKLGKEQTALSSLSQLHQEIIETEKYIHELHNIIEHESDTELREMAKEEYEQNDHKLHSLYEKAEYETSPENKDDKNSAILEIRAGAGGQEAGLFALDLFQMYKRYVDIKGWSWEEMTLQEMEQGGYREAVIGIEGEGVYGTLRNESGVHRVQRVPETESQGRLHTSTVTIAVLPQPNSIDSSINPNDIRVDTYRSSGKGGQHVNKTDSAVRITHFPTGIVVAIQDERSQIKNREKAFRLLEARIYNKKQEEQQKMRDQERREQVGTGERSERIRTYNYPNSRITDHRIGLTVYGIEKMMNGEYLDEFSIKLNKWRINQQIEQKLK
ncbi:hypothetical protein WA158_002426 [Blastocystis sp. Blastoise]